MLVTGGSIEEPVHDVDPDEGRGIFEPGRCPVAAPWPLIGVAHETCADRVQGDIAADLEEVVVALEEDGAVGA
jgi:hypothetical protein